MRRRRKRREKRGDLTIKRKGRGDEEERVGKSGDKEVKGKRK